ncbi:hypothetical protein GYMLUDRAFT_43299 [Collybiopsis luxurians FD-317 M1]|uniref:F-box domain-containing protein n=1 Tax=Collybiopsis luxurians FD-317 M1 TaxID=944289 RepID=A0A0D0CY24_9AGAR|nr:hypothetical protein GYMLUDRAFT_43299 [Collybiopsis luxurians FD-317 M1]
MPLEDYLSQPRIEGPVFLDQNDLIFLRARISALEAMLHGPKGKTNEPKQQCEVKTSAIKRQKSTLSTEIASWRNILSPIRRVPAEVLLEIFKELAHLHKTCSPTEYIDFLLAISSTCVAWRNLVHSTPEFWSYLCLDMVFHRQIFAGDSSWVKQWISRSKSLPLSVEIHLRATMRGTPKQEVSRTLECILDYRDRIRSIYLLGDFQLGHSLFRLPPSSFPLLDQLVLKPSRWSLAQGFGFEPQTVQAFLGAPKLQRVLMSEPEIRSSLDCFALPAEQLTFLYIHPDSFRSEPFDPSAYAHFLSRCRNLEHLTFHLHNTSRLFLDSGGVLHRWQNAGFSSDLSLFLPSLNYLDVSCRELIHKEGCNKNLLHCLTAPNLRDLTLRWSEQPIDSLLKDVVNFQNRSAVKLTSLTLVDCNHRTSAAAKEFTEILALFPTVTKLEIVDAAFELDRLMEALTWARDHSILLPKLTDLCLKFENHIGGESYPLHLTSMANSRWWPDGKEGDTGEAQTPLASYDDLCRLQNVTLAGLELTEDLRGELERLNVHVDLSQCYEEYIFEEEGEGDEEESAEGNGESG